MVERSLPAQLVERLLPTPEVRGSISIGDMNFDQYSTKCNFEKTKIKKKRQGMAHLKKANLYNRFCSKCPFLACFSSKLQLSIS